MPVMNDLDMLKRIRTDETLKDIPVMMLTAVAEQGEVMNAFLAGMLGGSDAQPIQHL
jgi:two-component system chemotaxis response regulator CheY